MKTTKITEEDTKTKIKTGKLFQKMKIKHEIESHDGNQMMKTTKTADKRCTNTEKILQKIKLQHQIVEIMKTKK